MPAASPPCPPLPSHRGGSPFQKTVRGARIASLVGLAFGLLAAPVSAEPDAQTRALAERFFDEGLALVAAGNFTEACPKLEKAVELTERQAAGGLLELGKCWEKLGRSASAWAIYREAAARAATLGQSEREREATKAAAALADKIAYLRLRIALPLDGMRVLRDGVELPRATLAESLPTDPGHHVVEVTAPGYAPYHQEFELAAGQGERTIDIPQLLKAPPAVSAAPSTSAAPSASSTVLPPGDGPSPWSTPRILGIGGAGVGAVVLATSLGVILSAKGDYDKALRGCTPASPMPLCPPAAKADVDTARGRGDLATGLFVAGAVVGAAGVVLAIVAPPAAPSAKPVATALSLRLGAGAIHLEGSW